MASKLLTDKKLKAMSGKGLDKQLSDGENLYIRFRGKGESWLFRFKVAQTATWADAETRGKVIEIGLGSYPEISLAKARELKDELRTEIAEGRDPRKLNELDCADSLGQTFQAYAEEYVAEAEKNWSNPKHRQQWRNTLRDYVYPEIGSKLAADITRDDVKRTIKPLWDDGKIETFSRVRMRIEAILDYAFHELEIDRSNPARWQGNLKISFGNVSPRKVAKDKGKLKPHAAPPWREVPAIMAKLRDKPEVVSALALRFSILTAARSMEVRGLLWAEIDLAEKVWRLPGERAKNGDGHNVPLNSEAVEILEQLAADKSAHNDLVFRGGRSGLISDVAVNKVLKAAYPGVTAHGIARSSFRDWIAEATNFPDKVAEAALNHANTNATEAAYLRTKYYDKRIELMNVWGSFLLGIDNVVLLNKIK
ncbi:tyrosine-type recombinase/integrase [Altererythrobacter aquiaggeris]|uniref:tyrosine-type recombinase/integrase n=1 Tax=Aestuarierythrobacter aquiaggeris TaxID=1898396 RepID=UPI003019FD5A